MDEQLAIFFPTIYAQGILYASITTIQLFMCTYCTYIFIQSSKEARKTTRLYIGFSLAIFFVDTFNITCTLTYYFKMLMGPKTLSGVRELEGELAHEWYLSAQSLTGDLVLLMGDGLLIYRCFIVWTGRRMVIALPIALYIATLVAILWGEASSFGSIHAPKSLAEAYYSLSAAVNCTVTFLIGWKLWQFHRRHIESHLSSNTKTYRGVIGIVAESALPFALATILLAVTHNQSTSHRSVWRPWKISENIARTCFGLTKALSPQLIIWRVTLGRSFAHNTNKGPMISSLAFNHNTVDLSHTPDIEGAASFEEMKSNSVNSGSEVIQSRRTMIMHDH